MRQLLSESEDVRQNQDEKSRFWFTNQHSNLTYDRLSGAIDGSVAQSHRVLATRGFIDGIQDSSSINGGLDSYLLLAASLVSVAIPRKL